MSDIEKVVIVMAREVWGETGTPIFPDSASGVFIDGKRLPTNAITISIDKDGEHAILQIPMRIVDFKFVNNLPIKDDIDWDAEELGEE